MEAKSVLRLFVEARRLSVVLLMTALAVVDVTPAGAQDGPAASTDRDSSNEVQWTEPINGLRFRLRIDKDVWQSWEPPFFWLDIRNETDRDWSAQQLRNELPLNRHGNHLQIVQKIAGAPAAGEPGTRKWTESELDALYMQQDRTFEFGQPGLRELAADSEIAVRIDLKSLGFQQWGDGVHPDTATLSLCRRTRSGPEFVGSPINVAVLPPGVLAIKQMDDFLTPYDVDGASVEAGFVPEATRLVDGEEILATFVVRNVGEQSITYGFGGDYRGANRHNRFKIEVQNRDGNSLKDPNEGRFDFGGLMSGVWVHPGRLSSQQLDLTKYRTFPGPGQYTVTARFDLQSFLIVGGQQFSIPVESKFALTILPRTEENVSAALERSFARCRKATGEDLDGMIDRLCAFGGEAAVPGLHELVKTGNDELQLAAVRGLGLIAEPSSLQLLLELERQPELRVAALRSLGSFSNDEAVQRVSVAVVDRELEVRIAAAGSLGRMKTPAAVRALLSRIKEVPKADGAGQSSTDEVVSEQQALVAALGTTGSAYALPVIRSSLDAADDRVRRTGVAAIIQFSTADAATVLPRYADDADLDFREFVIRQLAETLRQPIKAEWLVPVIRSRNGRNSIGDAPRLLRLHTDDRAAPTLVSCLDFSNPNVRSYYNATVLQQQLACRPGLAIDWINDLNRNGTAEETAKNRDTLARLKAWVAEYQRKPWREAPEPWRLPRGQEHATWGPTIGNVRIRARTNSSVWPEGLPQVLFVDVSRPNSGSVVMDSHPPVIEVEVDGEWYVHDPDVDDRVRGEWHAYKGNRFHSYQLTPHWKRVSDGEPLILKPGPHTARMRLTVPPEKSRAALATSLPVKFRVVAFDAKSDAESR
jgi:hypothetical protein